jgi:glycolate oxidase iron-sulfur subunit
VSQLTSTLAAEESKLLACIHCGLCLEACPTYVATGDENDGPRGRLYLMRAVGNGRLSNQSLSFERHIDRCLGCRACESVCPAGVEYGQLLEASRAELHTTRASRGFDYRILSLLLRHVWPYHARLKFFFFLLRLLRDSGVAGSFRRSGLARLCSPQFEFALALLESSAGEKQGKASRVKTTASGKPAMMFQGCVGDGLFRRINAATTRVLEANAYSVETPQQQFCCGALHAHAGDLDGARRLARSNILAFARDLESPIVTNAGGCGAMLKSYGHLLSDDPEFCDKAVAFSERVFDVGQVISSEMNTRSAPSSSQTITYDASCHLMYGQHAAEESLRMLKSVGDLSFVPLPGSERCCGGAGIYNLLEPELSKQVLGEKIESIRRAGADVIATGNPGCQMQIGAGARLADLNVRVCHPVELLDECYARIGRYE